MVDETKALGAYGVWRDVRDLDDEPMRMVCAVKHGHDGDLPREERDANARRIVACVNACKGIDPAAVADMLRDLRRCVHELELCRPRGNSKQDQGDIDGALELARQTIAKAEGRADV